jgi:predicted AlkP superfamily phosphohydrolase/phosphomutase
MVSFTYGLLRSGVKPGTLLGVAREILAESINPTLKWRRACLQPIINFDVFERLYKRSEPHFATFFTNHVAYYLHRYWRAYFPDQFQEVQEAEAKNYGQTIPHSLRVSDHLIGRTLSLIDDDTVLVVASALGQGPVPNPTNETQQNVLMSLDLLVKILGYDEMVRISGSMSIEHVLVCDDSNVRDQIVQKLSEIRLAGVTGERIFNVIVRNDTVCVSFTGQYQDLSCGIFSPSIDQLMTPQALNIQRYDVQPETGDHTADGILIMAGPGISKGVSIGEFYLRDVAPTILHLLDVEKPEQMKGRVLNEALQ